MTTERALPRTSTTRFTLDGSDRLEARLREICESTGREVDRLVPVGRLEGLVLGGGYGRGEGGVLGGPSGDEPYNDLEFYVFVRGNALLGERRLRGPLHEWGERLGAQAGLEIEFKVLTRAKLRRSPPSMFFYDLVMGHRRVRGDAALFAGCDHHRAARRIPLHEATRLLLNRCSGLLFARERLGRAGFGAADADFVGRNLAKAQLAFGDVVLTAFGRYHWSCRHRHRCLGELAPVDPPPAFEELRRHHAQGVEFKLHPRRSREGRDTLAARHREIAELGRQLWLWLEHRRLGREFRTVEDYALSGTDLCPERRGWRNRYLNWRLEGWRSVGRREAWHYPRGRLLAALPLLLWDDGPRNGEGRRQLGVWLGEPDGSPAQHLAAYTRLWRRFG